MNKILLFFYFSILFMLFPQLFAQELSDTSKNDNILQSDITEEPDSIMEKDDEIIIEDEDDILIIDESDEDILITDDSEENIIIDKKDNTNEIITNQSPVLSPGSEKEPDHDKHDQMSSETGADEKNLEVNLQNNDSLQKQNEKKEILIEKARSINFSRNLKEYRSPKKAMFMSLLIPGLGQAYSKQYWKTALFGAIEIGLIGLSAKFIYEGNQEKNRARKFADQNYNVKKFIEFYDNFSIYITTLATKDSTDTMDLKLLFDDSSANINNRYSPSNLSNYDSNERKDFDKDIQRIEFVQGWNDCEPYFNKDSGFILEHNNYKYTYKHYFTNTSNDEYKNDTTWLLNRFNIGDTVNALDINGIYGYSHNQNLYNDMIRSSTRFYDVSKYMIFILLTNHVVSAVDAFISARAFNDKLLKKQSIWQNINLDHSIAFTNFGIQSRVGLRIRF
jgi:hypothetical protein